MKKNYVGLLIAKQYPIKMLFTFGILLLTISSCKVTKQSAYFTNLQKDTTLKGFVSPNFEPKIIKGDRLSITVSSLSSLEDALFNSAGVSIGVAKAGAATGGYIVQQDGTIFLHRLGAVTVEGLTKKELGKQLENKLLAYMKEPIVQVGFLNHKITVLGEVRIPQVLQISDEQLSVIDALVLSGDVTLNAKRNNITVIREEGADRKVKHLNLEDHSIFSSEWYYVKPNDIILVSADSEKFVKEESRKKLQTNLSLAASAISLVIIILSRVIK
jgi:polysaccharide biosynthesis/export protein